MKIILEGKHLKLDSPHFEVVRDHFSVKNDNPRSKFAARKYIITPTGRVEVGMLSSICDYFTYKFPNIPIQIGKGIKELAHPSISTGNISNIKDYTYRDYQYGSIESMINNGRGVILIATSGGKSIIMGGFCKTILDHNPNSKILVMVPNVTLLTQTHKDFLGFDLDATKWSGTDVPDLSKNILFVNFQILLSDIKASIKKLSTYDYILIDEAHSIRRQNKINKVVFNLNTPHKFGFTGTLPENKLDMWNVFGKIGPVIYNRTSKELRDDKNISNVKVKVLKLHHKDSPKWNYKPDRLPNANYELETEFLYNSVWRNTAICNMANKLSGNCLLIVDRLDHGNLLKERLEELGNKEVSFIQGITSKEDRESIKSVMEGRNDVACVAMASIFSTGISIKNLPYVIFVCIGKSKTKVLQTIGRALRLHDNKEIAIIFDIADTTKYSAKHLVKRLKMYDLEQIPYEIKKISE